LHPSGTNAQEETHALDVHHAPTAPAILGQTVPTLGDSAIPFLDVARGPPVQPLHVTHDGRDLVTFGSTPIRSFATPTAADEH
jgi:hypothetical protein